MVNILATALYIFLLAITCLQPSIAAAEENPMTFSFQREDYRKYGLGLYQVIHAQGNINVGTPGTLRIFAKENNILPGGTIYLQSETGLLSEGVKLGRLIRSLGLETHIGGTDAKQPGHCFGACALAYLGGTSRFMGDNASYSVHRFYRRSGNNQEFDLDASQALANEINSYMSEMGTNPQLFKYMLLPGSEELVRMDKPTLVGFGAVNDGILYTNWELAKNESVPTLRGTIKNKQGTHNLIFRCDKRDHTLTGTFYLESSNPQWVLDKSTQAKGIFLDQQAIPVATDAKIENRFVTLPFPITPKFSQRVQSAGEIGIYLQPRDTPYSAGFKIRQTTESQMLMKSYFNECFASLPGGRAGAAE